MDSRMGRITILRISAVVLVIVAGIVARVNYEKLADPDKPT
jgi:hypothetical protein